MNAASIKQCFVIAPIGEDGSDTRDRSDKVLKHIITPACKECGYKPIRADEISEPGIITTQVIQHVVDDPLVIADITGRNPNVFYELAVRHAIRKPVVQIIQASETIPFDVAHQRTIKVDHKDLDSVAACVDELTRQIRAAEKDPAKVDTPISMALEVQTLRQSDNPLEKSAADIISMLQEVRASVAEISDQRSSSLYLRGLEEISLILDRAQHFVTLRPGEKPTKARLDEASKWLDRGFHAVEVIMMESGAHPETIRLTMGRRRRLSGSRE